MFESKISKRVLLAAVLLAALSGASVARRGGPEIANDPPARVQVDPGGVRWLPLRDFEGATLTLRGPRGEEIQREFPRGVPPWFDLESLDGAAVDGTYLWEIRFVPRISPELAEALRLAAENDDQGRTAELNRMFGVGHGSLVLTGQFQIREGQIQAEDGGRDIQKATAGPESFRPMASYDVSGAWTVTGNLGLGTPTPTERLDMTDTSPAIRMTDSTNNSSWFVNGNETGFDVSRGGKAPSDRVFYLNPAAPKPSIWVDSVGNWGNGTSVPSAPLHVRRVDGTARLIVEEASPTPLQRSVFRLRNNGGIRFDFEDTSGGSIWQFLNSGGLFRIINPGSPGLEFQLDKDGNLTLEGDVVANGILLTSDLEAKENLSPVDSGEVLERVLRLPISEWNLKNRPAARHIGPTAQDFHHIVRVGADERRISPIDTAGAALAAVQGLHALLLEKDRELEDLRGVLTAQKAELQSLKARLEEIQTLLPRR